VALTRRGPIPSLDGLRALAIAIVIWGHAALPGVIPGSAGVTIFYFLSGYLITTLLRREADDIGRISITRFSLRRVLRIQPPLYVVLLVVILISLAQLIPNRMTFWGAFSGATFWQNYYIIAAGRDGLPAGMNALWSLAVEEHYYLVFPVLYLLLRRLLPNRLHQAGVLALVCLGILAWRSWLVFHDASYDRVYLATDTRADAILWGSVLALSMNPADDLPQPARRWPWALLAVVCFAAFCGVARLPESVVMSAGYTVQSLLLAGVFVGVVRAPTSLPGLALGWRPIAFTGVLSYGLYLVHRPILELAAQHVPGPRPVQLAVALILMAAAALGLHLAVEKPSVRLRQRLQR
jgi:peptidoglycan/LPS O-acetylase OafA/YrhL